MKAEIVLSENDFDIWVNDNDEIIHLVDWANSQSNERNWNQLYKFCFNNNFCKIDKLIQYFIYNFSNLNLSSNVKDQLTIRNRKI